MLANHGCPALKGYMPVGSEALTGQEPLSVVSSEDDSYPAPAILLSVLLNRQEKCGLCVWCTLTVMSRYNRSTDQDNIDVRGLLDLL